MAGAFQSSTCQFIRPHFSLTAAPASSRTNASICGTSRGSAFRMTSMEEEHTLAAVALRILSYNVRYFGHALRGLASTRGSKRAIADALSSLEPAADIICLQEVETL